jgi:hypothetical protein
MQLDSSKHELVMLAREDRTGRQRVAESQRDHDAAAGAPRCRSRSPWCSAPRRLLGACTGGSCIASGYIAGYRIGTWPRRNHAVADRSRRSTRIRGCGARLRGRGRTAARRDRAVAGAKRGCGWTDPVLGGDVDLSSLWIEIDGTTYRVNALSPTPPTGRESLYEVTSRTAVRVFSPSAKSAVDVVVLADCSGSMSWKDLTDSADPMGRAANRGVGWPCLAHGGAAAGSAPAP